MKNISLIAIIILLFFSCDKNNNDSSYPLNDIILKETALSKGQKIASINNIEQRKLAYSTLNNDEKYFIWNEKINSAITNNKYSKKQLISLSKITPHITKSIFIDNDSYQIFLVDIFPNWLNMSKDIFTEKEIYDLFFNIENKTDNTLINSKTINTLGSEGGQSYACHCKVGSGYTCIRFTYGFPQAGACSATSNCVTRQEACGLLWEQACDGDLCTW